MPNESTSSTSFASEPYAVLTTLGSLPSEHGVRSVHSPAPATVSGFWSTGWSMCLISCSAKFIGDLTLWGRNHLLYWETVGRKTAHRGTRAAGCGGGASQISQVFSQQLRRQPRAPLGSDLFDEKELRPEPLRPHRCRLLGFGPPQVWSADVRHLRVATAVSSRLGLGSGVCPSRTPSGAGSCPPRQRLFDPTA